MSISSLNTTQDAPDADDIEWVAFLKSQIDFVNWRAGEFDFETMILAPDVTNPRTFVKECDRDGCGILLPRGSKLCPSCKNEFIRLSRQNEVNHEDFVASTRPERTRPEPGQCTVSNCERTEHVKGLCTSHGSTYRLYVANKNRRASVSYWLQVRKVTPSLGPLPRCAVDQCPFDKKQDSRLCLLHSEHYRKSCQNRSWLTLDLWLETLVEPYVDSVTGLRYSSMLATPFGLLKEPVRWELLYALQQRDLEGRSGLHAIPLRVLYLKLRAQSVETLVGKEFCGWDAKMHSNMRGFLKGMQWHIDEGYRKWRGPEWEDPKLVLFRDLVLRTGRDTVYKTRALDLREVTHDWVAESVLAWVHAVPHSPNEIWQVERAWKILDATVPPERRHPRDLKGSDMDKSIAAIVQYSDNPVYQRRLIRGIKMVLDYVRADDALRQTWDQVSPGFSINPVIHRPLPRKGNDAGSGDEPFRFVPQPVVDWVMDHLHLLKYSTVHKTAEARVMVYLQERCGRRTSETVSLREDCISYDDSGAPYLEWRQGKPPYRQGARLPIHQETHDVIRQWQKIKRSNGVESVWLFPSDAWATKDKHYDGAVLQSRVKRLVKEVSLNAPFTSNVEGAEGNLVNFDVQVIDSYSFRHAFAQRLADAVDENGNATTPSDVLQSYMGHASFHTTMGYYEVTAKRRRRALGSLPSRKIDIYGTDHGVSDERDPYQRIGLTVGSCTEPQNVASAGRSCALDHACESCPFFLVDPLEREGIVSRRTQLEVQRERAAVINSPQYYLSFLEARIDDCDSVVNGIDRYIQQLPERERKDLSTVLKKLAEVRRRATAPRMLDLRSLLKRSKNV